MNTPLPEQGRPDTAGGSVRRMGGPIIPDGYPYFDSNPRARCGWLWGHGKATVRTIVYDSVLIERYDCRCGKYYWLSQQDGAGPIVRYRS